MSKQDLHVLIYCGQTVACESRSGIQRVVLESIKSFVTVARIDLVKWDPIEGQLRYLSLVDLEKLFPRQLPEGLLLNNLCARVNYRFGDTIENVNNTWLLYPEISYHGDNTSGTLNKILSQCSSYNIKTACIFYDLIPVRDSDYKEYASLHSEYLLDILRFDKIFPISKFSGLDLINFYREHISNTSVHYIQSLVEPVLLGEGRDRLEAADGVSIKNKKNILLLGTVEPRKQQTRFLKIFNSLRDNYPNLNDYTIHVVGSLHPLSADLLLGELEKNTRIKYHRYIKDEQVKEILDSCRFTAFISRSEGYGLPIVESLQRNVPCLTANFGSMSELAVGGGCLQVDVMDDQAIADGILQLTDDQNPVLDILYQQAVTRTSRTWEDYVSDLAKYMKNAQAIDFKQLKKSDFEELSNQKALQFECHGVVWDLFLASGTSKLKSQNSQNEFKRSICYVDYDGKELSKLAKTTVKEICSHDLVVFESKTAYRKFSNILASLELEVMPPLNSIALTQGIQRINDIILYISTLTRTLLANAKKESIYFEASRELSKTIDRKKPLLTIIISTFNRANFSYLNVKWLLSILKKYADQVKLVVVDNSSTDDTVSLLNEFNNNNQFELIVNANNTGMLGNLRVCSNITDSGHVWLVGDDDFISSEAIDEVLNLISENSRTPLINVNFSVYFRQSISCDENVKDLVAEGLNISRTPAESGFMKTIDIVNNHDNVFTAVYPIIWRADLLAACFNYPFDGTPFESLVESIPTTKYILENHAFTDSYWLKATGITANAHNSWSKHRPRWHSVLMPLAIDLARSSGLSLKTSWKWLKVHLPLYNESIEHCIGEENFNIESWELDRAKWIFRI